MASSEALAASRSALRADERVAGVVQALQHDIVFGRLKPRERLVEEEIGARFGVGRHVVRSVLEELDRQGLVKRRPNRGAVVSDYTTEEVEHLYDMRSLLQREAALRIVLPGSPEFVAELAALNDEFLACSERGDLDPASNANDRFHQTLFAACRNPFLAEAIQQYWVKTAAIHCYAIASPGLARRSRDEHAGMIDAVAQGDRERLVHLCVAHMMPALDAYKAAHGGWVNHNIAR